MVRGGFLPLDLGVINLTRTAVGAPDRDWRRFAEGYDAVVEKHTAWARVARPDYAILKGLTESLQDNQTIFIEPDEFRRGTEASYAGIGVRLAKPEADQAPVIVEVFPRSPAVQSGLRPGDRILAVDGQRIAEMALGEVVKRIRGPVGTRLDLSLLRGVQASPFSVEVIRAAVEPRRVEARIVEPRIGYLRIRGFGTEVPSQVAEQLTRGRSQDVRGWVIDMRGNGGGSLSAAANVAGHFFPGQLLGQSMDRAGNREPINADGRKLITNEHVFVLIDRDTSGGSEILAAALREYRIATTIGSPTSGSVGIAIPHELSDGSAVQITVRRLLTPGGARIDRGGLQPDEEVPLSVSDLESGKDPPLERAVERIRQRIG